MSRTEIRYERLNHQNFDRRSLDGFIRRQTVRESWRKIDGTWRLIPNDYEESWDLIRRREVAADVERHMETDQSAFGAFPAISSSASSRFRMRCSASRRAMPRLSAFRCPSHIAGRALESGFSRWRPESWRRSARTGCTSPRTLQGKVKPLTARWAASTRRRSTRLWPPRSRSTCRSNTSRQHPNRRDSLSGLRQGAGFAPDSARNISVSNCHIYNGRNSF